MASFSYFVRNVVRTVRAVRVGDKVAPFVGATATVLVSRLMSHGAIGEMPARAVLTMEVDTYGVTYTAWTVYERITGNDFTDPHRTAILRDAMAVLMERVEPATAGIGG